MGAWHILPDDTVQLQMQDVAGALHNFFTMGEACEMVEMKP